MARRDSQLERLHKKAVAAIQRYVYKPSAKNARNAAWGLIILEWLENENG